MFPNPAEAFDRMIIAQLGGGNPRIQAYRDLRELVSVMGSRQKLRWNLRFRCRWHPLR